MEHRRLRFDFDFVSPRCRLIVHVLKSLGRRPTRCCRQTHRTSLAARSRCCSCCWPAPRCSASRSSSTATWHHKTFPTSSYHAVTSASCGSWTGSCSCSSEAGCQGVMEPRGCGAHSSLGALPGAARSETSGALPLGLLLRGWHICRFFWLLFTSLASCRTCRP